jgi:hypothetical protein
MIYKYLNKFIDEKAMRHHKFNNDKNFLVYFTKQDPDPAPVWSELRGRIRIRSKRPEKTHKLCGLLKSVKIWFQLRQRTRRETFNTIKGTETRD